MGLLSDICHSLLLFKEYILLQAHFHKEAAQLLLQLAKSEAASHAPPLRIKKLYLLAALEVDQLKARMLNIGEQPGTGSPGKTGSASTGTAAAAHTLAGETSSHCLSNEVNGPTLVMSPPDLTNLLELQCFLLETFIKLP